MQRQVLRHRALPRDAPLGEDDDAVDRALWRISDWKSATVTPEQAVKAAKDPLDRRAEQAADHVEGRLKSCVEVDRRDDRLGRRGG